MLLIGQARNETGRKSYYRKIEDKLSACIFRSMGSTQKDAYQSRSGIPQFCFFAAAWVQSTFKLFALSTFSILTTIFVTLNPESGNGICGYGAEYLKS